MKVGCLKVGCLKVCCLEVGVLKVDSLKVGRLEVELLKICFLKIDCLKVLGVLKLNFVGRPKTSDLVDCLLIRGLLIDVVQTDRVLMVGIMVNRVVRNQIVIRIILVLR